MIQGYSVNPSHDLANGLLAWWEVLPNLNGGGYRWVDLVNGISGTLTGALPTNGFRSSNRPGSFGDWLGDGSTGFVNIGSGVSALNLPGTMSASAFFNTTTVASGTKAILADCNSGGTTTQFALEINRTAGKLDVEWNGAAFVGTGTTALSTNTWYHGGFMRSGSINNWSWELYLNGNLDNSGTTASNPSTQSGFAIGELGGFTGGIFFFPGRLNSVQLWNRQIVPQEWKQLPQLGSRYWQGLLIRPTRRFYSVGTVHALSLSASASVSASIIKQINKPVTASVSSMASVGKQVGKPLSASVSGSASLVKQAGKALSATSMSSVSMSKQVGKALSASVASVASVMKQAGKSLSASVTSAASFEVKQVGKTLVASVGSIASAQKRMTKTLSASVSSTAALTANFLSAVGHSLIAVIKNAATDIVRRFGSGDSVTRSGSGDDTDKGGGRA